MKREYTPSPTGKRFMKSDAFMRVIQGPIGSGKSVLCVMEIVRRCVQQKKGPDGKRRSRWVVVRNTLPQLKDTTMKTFFDWIPPGAAGKWSATEKNFYLSFGDVEAEILFRPLDSPEDIHRVLSLELTGAWFNECREIPKEIVDAVGGRLKRYPKKSDGGSNFWGMIADTNPPNEDNWWADHMTNPPENWEVFFQPSGVGPEAENREHLEDDYYENLMIGKSEDWINVYVHGKFGQSVAGKPVYEHSFSSDLHLKSGLEPIPTAPLVIGMDFGLTPACVIGQLTAFGRAVILEEITSFDMGLERFINNKLLPVLNDRYKNMDVLIVGDPTGAYRVGTDENTAFRMLRKQFGFQTIAAPSNNPTERIGAVEHFLTTLVEGAAALWIDVDRCPMLARGFRSMYRYPKRKSTDVNGMTVFGDSPEKNDFSHVHDACQYFALHLRKGHVMGDGGRLHGNSSRPPLPAQPSYNPGVW